MVPNLRFKKYSNDWVKYKITDLGKMQRGKSKHRPRDDEKLYGGEYPFIQTGDIKKAHLYINEYEKTYSTYGLSQSKLWKKGTLCITIAANIAETAILGMDACFPDSIIGWCSNNQLTNNLFIKYYFDFYKEQLKRLSVGGAQENLNLDKLEKIYFNIPSLQEQNKIADFFYKIDEKIVTQIKIIDDYISLLNSLRDHLIYTHNSKKATLSGYIDIYNGYTFKSKNYIKDGKYKVITISNVTGQRFVNLASINTINKIPFDIQNYQIIAKDSILVSLTGNVGRTSICNVDNCLLNQRVALVKCKNIDSKYIYHILSSTRFLRKMCLSSQGAAQKNISTKDILDYMIPLHSNQEIKNITRLLEAVESKLDIEKNILNFLYQQKTYLLKNMFI